MMFGRLHWLIWVLKRVLVYNQSLCAIPLLSYAFFRIFIYDKLSNGNYSSDSSPKVFNDILCSHGIVKEYDKVTIGQ